MASGMLGLNNCLQNGTYMQIGLFKSSQIIACVQLLIQAMAARHMRTDLMVGIFNDLTTLQIYRA